MILSVFINAVSVVFIYRLSVVFWIPEISDSSPYSSEDWRKDTVTNRILHLHMLNEQLLILLVKRTMSVRYSAADYRMLLSDARDTVTSPVDASNATA